MKKTMIAALTMILGLTLSLEVNAQTDGGKISKRDRSIKKTPVEMVHMTRTAESGTTGTLATRQVRTIQAADAMRVKPSKAERSRHHALKPSAK